MSDPVPDYYVLATSDVLTVLARALRRVARLLAEKGYEGDLRPVLEEDFRRFRGHGLRMTPGPLNPQYEKENPQYEKDYESLLHLFWLLYDQEERQLRVFDPPEGHA